MVWLHGTLYVSILEARDLVNDTNLGHFIPSRMPGKLQLPVDTGKVGQMFSKFAKKAEAQLARTLHTESPPDCYCVVSLNEARVAHTSVTPQSNHPQWGERFVLLVAHDTEEVLITVKDQDLLGAKFMGKMWLPASQVAMGQLIEGWFPLFEEDGKTPMKSGHLTSMLHIVVQYQNVLQDAALQHDAPFRGLDHTYFPARGGCRMTLYKDAHVDHVPEIPLSDGRLYQPACCWIDMYSAICAAKHFIYVTGWSVYTELKLIRDPSKPNNETPYPTLGELLKAKAAEGVRVLCMVWDDRTSVGLVNSTGVMGTHDEETRKYFQNTGVTCQLFVRAGLNESTSILNRNTTDRIFTHHQKTVILDSPYPEGGQHGAGVLQLTAFMGGIDVTNGRYDTGRHSIFRTLQTEHSDDLHQPCIPGADPKFGGPREPWHDIHCRMEGPAAWDILSNFEQRWQKQGKDVSVLLNMAQVPGLAYGATAERDDGVPAVMVTPPGSPEEWRVQVFRSIDSDSASGFPQNFADVAAMGLDSSKGRIIEYSIQKAYINAIRQAEHFIYIENQYFLGSSHCWAADRHAGATHLVPIEVALKIVAKINAGERFMAYIMVPLFPEGPPESGAVQEILYWQSSTVQMMYTIVADAIKAKGLNAHPTDYLQFFAPANRETMLPGEVPSLEKAPANSGLALAQETRRHMIYVHSKMMIVDDEYIIIGSANINQRSMDGGRDTEIAMGAFQPQHFASAAGHLPRGDIHGFRMALWEEHSAIIHPSFYHPSSMECVEQMRNIGKTNWEVFAGPEVRDMPGHLMLYPYVISLDGVVTAIQELIPDSKKALVCGSKSASLPCILTT